LVFGINDQPVTIHSVIITIKIIIIFLYLRYQPYVNFGFNFFKILQEFMFILMSSFLIKLHKQGISLENQTIIEEKDLTDYFNSGIILVEMIEAYLIIGFFAFLNSTVFSVYNFLNNN
jgi:hypothetical protein